MHMQVCNVIYLFYVMLSPLLYFPDSVFLMYLSTPPIFTRYSVGLWYEPNTYTSMIILMPSERIATMGRKQPNHNTDSWVYFKSVS